MASPENMTATLDPWSFRPSYADSWISEAFARDTETLTRALQKSISNSFSNSNSDSLSPLLSLINPNPSPTTPTASTVSGSDLETAPKRRRMTNTNTPPTGKPSKRKSRSTKRSQTTFITADPANFRQMVQQVTGVSFSNSHMSCLSPILKPEPQRLVVNRLQNGTAGPGGTLPTLDTSAFLLDHQQPSSGGEVFGSSRLLPFHTSVVSETALSTGANLDSDSFANFPTLESWKA